MTSSQLTVPASPPSHHQQKAIALWVKEFEQHYFSRRSRTPKSESTWKGDYLKIFRRLPQNEPLTPEILMAMVLATSPDTKTRKRCCMVLGALARFAGLAVDLNSMSGTYSPTKVQSRVLPSDELIVASIEAMPSTEWRWAYGMLATYGLRPHELFHLDCQRLKSGDPILRVCEGKTGDRVVFPLYPEWAKRFDLNACRVPNVSGHTNSDLGHRVTQVFRRAGLSFRPYDLRHSWAVRTLEFGLDVSLAAQQMGHSNEVHTNIYRAWITDYQLRKAFNNLLNQRDRPLAP